MNDFKKHIAINKTAWNKKTPIHIASDFYNNTEFKNGKTSLKSIELDALGSLKGKDFLHLQCHFGQDSMSFARIGANVTAVDFSNTAINKAKELSKEINIPVNFIENDVMELNLNKEFDIVFSSYGAIGWLPDLKNGGQLYFAI